MREMQEAKSIGAGIGENGAVRVNILENASDAYSHLHRAQRAQGNANEPIAKAMCIGGWYRGKW